MSAKNRIWSNMRVWGILRGKSRVYTADCPKNGLQRCGLPLNHLPHGAPWAKRRAFLWCLKYTTLPVNSGLSTKHKPSAATRWWHSQGFRASAPRGTGSGSQNFCLISWIFVSWRRTNVPMTYTTWGESVVTEYCQAKGKGTVQRLCNVEWW